MSILKTDIETIATLAQLEVNEDSMELYSNELSNIMEMIRSMQDINTDAIEPMPHPQDIELRLRADEVTEIEQRNELQAIAPQTSDGLYLVPKVLG